MNSNYPGLSKTHPMDAFGAFLHNPFATEFLPDKMNIVIYIMTLKIQNGFNIYEHLEKLMIDFKENNRLELQDKGLIYYLNELKLKVINEEPFYIGIILYCLNIMDCDYYNGEPKILWEKAGARQHIDISKPKDKVLTKYTDKNRKEITITVKSISRALIKDIFKYETEEGKKEIYELCFKMIEKEYKK